MLLAKSELGGGRREKKATQLCMSRTFRAMQLLYIFVFQIGTIVGLWLLIKLTDFGSSYFSVVAVRGTGTHVEDLVSTEKADEPAGLVVSKEWFWQIWFEFN